MPPSISFLDPPWDWNPCARVRLKLKLEMAHVSSIILAVAFATSLLAIAANAQETESRHVIVEAEGEELPTAYGAPPDMSHGRISTLTKSYVLSPFSFELEVGYEGSIFRDGLPSQLFRQEIEMGLPARFTVGVQNQVEHFAGDTRERSCTLEARYALANWNKLPVNPAISAECGFGRTRSAYFTRFSSSDRMGDEHLC